MSYLSDDVGVYLLGGLLPPFSGDLIAGKLRYSNSELTDIVEETLIPGIRDRGEISVTFSGIFPALVL
jgi:hypothetical protein